MKPIATRAALAAALLAATPLAAQQSFDWNGGVSAGSTLRVFTQNGTVTVTASSDGRAHIHGTTENASSGEIRYLTVGGSGGDVRVCAVRDDATCGDNGIDGRGNRGWSMRNRRGRANFTVSVPRGVVVRVSSGNGDVTVDGATADVNAGSGNGDVRVGSGAAQVSATTGNGAVMVENARGPVRASSGNGRVTINAASGPVNASTGNGRIEVAIASLRGAGDMEFSSGNGSVTLTLPPDFGADFEGSTGNGSIQTDFPVRVQGRVSAHRMLGTIGNGGRRLHLSTGNGSINLRRAGS